MEQPPCRVLACFAHPDDESFSCGGTMARATAAGHQVALLCVTRGECGEIADPALATPATLPQVREQELRAALQALGVDELVLLSYRDSGMAGTLENADPRAYMNADDDTVVGQIVAHLRRLRPHVVITFDPAGGYGHPDHMAISRHTAAAFHASGDPTRFAEAGAPWQPTRLFWTTLPRSLFGEMRAAMADGGADDEMLQAFEDRGWPDDQITAQIDVADFIEAKWQAIESHRTQLGTATLFRKLPHETLRRLMEREYYVLAAPAPAPDTRLEDLFDGMRP